MLALIARRGSAIRLRQLAVYEFAKSQDLCLDFCTTQGASVRQRRARRPLQKLEKVTSGTFSKRQASHSGGLFLHIFMGGKVRRTREGWGMIGLGKSVCCQGRRAWGDAQGAEGSEAIGHLGGNKGTALLIKQKTQWVMKKANAPDTPKEKDMKKAKGTRNPLHPPCKGDASAFGAAAMSRSTHNGPGSIAWRGSAVWPWRLATRGVGPPGR